MRLIQETRASWIPRGASLSQRSLLVAAAVVAFAACAGFGADAAAEDPRVDIVVEEPRGVARRGWPVGVGVPFPRGALADTGSLRLGAADGAGGVLPHQARVLSRWPDGSVRWALVDWRVDLGARQRRSFVLRKGTPPEPLQVLRVVEGDESVSVDTGALKFLIPRERFAIVDSPQVNGEPALASSVGAFVEIGGKRYAAQAPESIRVLESGPLRTRIELRGEYGAGLHYVVRIDVFAGHSFVRLLHSFEYRGDEAELSMSRLAIDLPLEKAKGASYRAGREEHPPLEGKLEKKTASLVQEDARALRLDGALRPGRAAGWFDLQQGGRGLAIGGRFFWQEFPQGFRFDETNLSYDLWAKETGPASIGMGAAKTHEVALDFRGGSTPPATEVASLVEPLVAHVDPKWMVASGALGNSIAPDAVNAAFLDALRTGFDRYREKGDSTPWDDRDSIECKDPAFERRREGFYGMLNWGDWNFPWYHDQVNGCETWGNLEYDMTQVLALAHAASGARDFHTTMTAAARHHMDVDRIHHGPPDCNCTGMVHPRVSRHFNFELGKVDPGYAWTEGLLSYYYLTGDERALDAARGIADFLVRVPPDTGARPRQWGWPIIALVATYRATGDEKYLTAAKDNARRAMASYAPNSGRDVGVGTLADALAYLHEETRDESLEKWLSAHAGNVMASRAGADPRYFPAVAYVGRLRGEVDYKRAARDAVPRQEFGNWGKPFTLAGRLGFRILSLVPEKLPDVPATPTIAGEEEPTAP